MNKHPISVGSKFSKSLTFKLEKKSQENQQAESFENDKKWNKIFLGF